MRDKNLASELGSNETTLHLSSHSFIQFDNGFVWRGHQLFSDAFPTQTPVDPHREGAFAISEIFFCYIYQTSRCRRVFNYIIRAKRRPSPEVLPAWSCFRLATAALSCALSIGKDLMAKRVLYYQLAPLLYEPDPRNQVPPSLEWGWNSYEISLAAQFFSQCRTSLLELCFSRQGAMWRFNTRNLGFFCLLLHLRLSSSSTLLRPQLCQLVHLTAWDSLP